MFQTRALLKQIDEGSMAMIYGAVMVLALLAAMADHPDTPWRMAATLFGSVLAIVLSKAFAEVVGRAAVSGNRLSRVAIRDIWRHSRPALVAANIPAVLLLAAGFADLPTDAAVQLSQIFCIALLAGLGLRAGWVVEGRLLPTMLAGLFTGGLGLLLAGLKMVMH